MNFARLLEEKAHLIVAKTGIRPVLVAVTDVDRSVLCLDGLPYSLLEKWKAAAARPATASVTLNLPYSEILDRVESACGSTVFRHVDAREVLDTMFQPGIPVIPGIPEFPGLPAIVVEATPTNLTTGEPGLSHLTQALERGFSAVTLAKGPLVVAFCRLRSLAATKRAGLKYSGAVAAALPTVDTAIHSMAGTSITEIEGVLNGTTNFILNSMAGGRSYSDALAQARAMGVAEADPTLDVEGFDSAAKLLIIANTVWGTDHRLLDVSRQGITGLSGAEVRKSAAEGTPVRLVARAGFGGDAGAGAGKTKICLSVQPEPVPRDHPFRFLPGTQKAVRFESAEMGDIIVSGGASDVVGAAAAALKDLIHLLEERATGWW